MSNHFATLGIAATLLPDDDLLRDRFYAASARFHPDSAEADEDAFLRIHEAFATLRNPSRRLFHLLELHQRKSADAPQPPQAVMDLFFTTNHVLQSAGENWKRYNASSSPLQKAMLLDSVLETDEKLAALRTVLDAAIAENLDQLSTLENAWPNLSELQWSTLAEIARSLAYLTKWKNEVEQSQTRIAETTSGAIR